MPADHKPLYPWRDVPRKVELWECPLCFTRFPTEDQCANHMRLHAEDHVWKGGKAPEARLDAR